MKVKVYKHGKEIIKEFKTEKELIDFMKKEHQLWVVNFDSHRNDDLEYDFEIIRDMG